MKPQTGRYFYWGSILCLTLFSIFWWITYQFGQWLLLSLGGEGKSILPFLVLALLRPLCLMPVTAFVFLMSEHFGLLVSAMLSSVLLAISAFLPFFLGDFFGRKYVRPWLHAEIPKTTQLLLDNQLKLIFFLRSAVLPPFEISSIYLGEIKVRKLPFFFCTLWGIIPECLLGASLCHAYFGKLDSWELFIAILCAAIVYSSWFHHAISAKRHRRSFWHELRALYYFAAYEVKLHHEDRHLYQHQGDKVPVVLLHGFFSTQKSLQAIENHLEQAGFPVMSLELGGTLGVFFTRGIKESASLFDHIMKRQMERHGFQKFHIIAHSKGGLVAAWWLSKMSGSRYCNRLITLGTPFAGVWHAWLIILSPFGFFWRSVWQMRPNSRFFRELNEGSLPTNLELYHFVSDQDFLARGERGVWRKGFEKATLRLDHSGHFEMVHDPQALQNLLAILRQDYSGTPGERRKR